MFVLDVHRLGAACEEKLCAVALAITEEPKSSVCHAVRSAVYFAEDQRALLVLCLNVYKCEASVLTITPPAINAGTEKKPEEGPPALAAQGAASIAAASASASATSAAASAEKATAAAAQATAAAATPAAQEAASEAASSAGSSAASSTKPRGRPASLTMDAAKEAFVTRAEWNALKTQLELMVSQNEQLVRLLSKRLADEATGRGGKQQ